MFTTGFKYLCGAAVVLLGAAALYAWTSGGIDWDLFPSHLGDLYFAMLGGLTLGWRGAVGDHLGYAVLVGGALGFASLATAFILQRDNEATELARVAGSEVAPAYRLPGTPNYFAPLAGLALGMIALGLATTPWFVGAGIVLAVVVGAEWLMAAWADRATGDPRLNRALRSRIMLPIEAPVGALLVIGFVVVGMSRALLAVSKEASVWMLIGVAGVIFVAAGLIAMMPKISAKLLQGAIALVAGAVLVAGVLGAAAGEREFEHHGADHGEEVGTGDEHGTTAGEGADATHSETSEEGE
ncbi:MAG: hypothetical protein OEY23_15730 [Acidimicrobiia bacterium]|nr:hypothetical protein [Acidimicrobiia bacterium]